MTILPSANTPAFDIPEDLFYHVQQNPARATRRKETENMNSKSTNKPAGRATSRPEARGGAKATTKGKSPRPGEKTAPSEGYGIYREAAPAAKATPPPAGRPPATSAIAEALRAVTAEVKALKNDAAKKDTEINALQKRLTQMETRQKAQEKAYRTAQYPTGAIASQPATEPSAGEEPAEVRPARSKASAE